MSANQNKNDEGGRRAPDNDIQKTIYLSDVFRKYWIASIVIGIVLIVSILLAVNRAIGPAAAIDPTGSPVEQTHGEQGEQPTVEPTAAPAVIIKSEIVSETFDAISSNETTLSIDNIYPLLYEGETLMRVNGWAMLGANISEIPDGYDDFLFALKNDSGVIYYTIPDKYIYRPDLGLHIGYVLYLNCADIPSGNYQIGFVFLVGEDYYEQFYDKQLKIENGILEADDMSYPTDATTGLSAYSDAELDVQVTSRRSPVVYCWTEFTGAINEVGVSDLQIVVKGDNQNIWVYPVTYFDGANFSATFNVTPLVEASERHEISLTFTREGKNQIVTLGEYEMRHWALLPSENQ